MKNNFIQGLKYWGQIFLLPVYWFSFLTPRSDKIWLFGSTFGNRFADNPKYLYLYVSQKRSDEVRPIWLTHNKDIAKQLFESGYDAYYYHSLKGIWYCLRAKAYIFDNYSKDISFWLSGGAVKINLWHGVGNKRINYDNKFDKIRHPENKWQRFKTYLRRMSDEKPSHYILATSPTKAKIFASAFRTDISHIIEDGLPRDDSLFDWEVNNLYMGNERILLDRIAEWKQEGKRINCYMPTFRKSEVKFFEVMDLAKFNDFLKQKNMIFLMKLHPKSLLKKRFEEISYSNIVNADADIDPYTFLKQVDILTTDYSSIYTDFMLLNRPVIGFYYDYDLYSQDTRECYFDFNEYMPEIKAIDMNELMLGIDSVLQGDQCQDKRRKSRDIMFSKIDGNACESLFSKVQNIIAKEGRR